MSETDVAERLFREKADWFELIKALRAAHGVGIFEAESLALRHEGWRRWAQQRIDADAKCRKYAAGHFKRHGEDGLIRQGESQGELRVKTPDAS